MPSAIRGSSSQMRIEQSAKLVLLMVTACGAAKRETARGSAASRNGPRCPELSINPPDTQQTR